MTLDLETHRLTLAELNKAWNTARLTGANRKEQMLTVVLASDAKLAWGIYDWLEAWQEKDDDTSYTAPYEILSDALEAAGIERPI